MNRLLAVLSLALAANIFAIPQRINYQGQLTPVGGAPLDTTVVMTFALYIDDSGGAPLWDETHIAVDVVDGIFNVVLGSVIPVPNIFNDAAWLGITVGSDSEMEPRQEMVSVPHAYRVATVDRASGGYISSSTEIAGTLNVGDANGIVPGYGMVVGSDNFVNSDLSSITGGSDNSVTSDRSHIGGGIANTTTGSRSVIGGGQNNHTRGPYSAIAGGGGLSLGDSNSVLAQNGFIGGGSGNLVEQVHGVVGGGIGNKARGIRSFVGGGSLNTVSSIADWGGIVCGDQNSVSNDRAFIGGGTLNQATNVDAVIGGGSSNTASGQNSFIGGGFSNAATTLAATVSGGEHNYARGDHSTIGGGGATSIVDSNSASGSQSTIGGGAANLASGNSSTVAGGARNIASGSRATVGGGRVNRAAGDFSVIAGGGGASSSDSNLALASYSAIGGGRSNETSGNYSAVAGGFDNLASGAYSFAVGNSNEAQGDYSVALGRRAIAPLSGCFRFADATNANFSAPVDTLTNNFSVRAVGGVNFYTNTALTNGVELYPGGSSWHTVSDSTKKRNIRRVDTHDILERVIQLPMNRWSYKSQDEGVEHIGPMAQDFWKLFHVGSDSLKISTIDPAGIALAAIQELAKRSDRIDELESEVAELKRLVEQMIQLGHK